MNVNKVKFFAWLGAVGLTAGLGYYVFDYTTGLGSKANPFDADLATKILDQEHKVEEFAVNTVDLASVRTVFHEFDWTGKPPPPKPVGPIEKPTLGPTTTPVSELVHLLFISEDSDRPEGSTVFLMFADKSKVKTAVAGVTLRVGDRLNDPLQYIRIESISGFDGVAFAFDDEERESETVIAPNFDPQIQIVSGSAGSILGQRDGKLVPKYTGPAVEPPKMSKKIGRDHFQLGTEDMFLLSDDYPEILSREIQYRRHKDPKTGRYDGIELQKVKAGGTMARHGAQAGDVIKSINGNAVTSVSEAITFVKNNSDNYDTWLVVVENMGRQRTVRYDSPPTIQR